MYREVQLPLEVLIAGPSLYGKMRTTVCYFSFCGLWRGRVRLKEDLVRSREASWPRVHFSFSHLLSSDDDSWERVLIPNPLLAR